MLRPLSSDGSFPNCFLPPADDTLLQLWTYGIHVSSALNTYMRQSENIFFFSITLSIFERNHNTWGLLNSTPLVKFVDSAFRKPNWGYLPMN
jgi:hypothetical protein